MTYTVQIQPKALKQLKKIHPEDRKRIREAIRSLADDPRPPYPKGRKMEGVSGELHEWRLRIGQYRVVYDIYDNVLVVNVVKVAKRGQAKLYSEH